LIDKNLWDKALKGALSSIQTSEMMSFIQNLVRHIVPLKSNPNLDDQSFSSRRFPNIVFKSLEKDSIVFGETLIHEADHQFLYIAESYYSFLNTNSNQENYYSPWRDDPRPLDGVFKGLSAFTRVCMYYHRLINNCSPNYETEILKILAHRYVQSENAKQTLIESQLLTETGQNYLREINRELFKVKGLLLARQDGIRHVETAQNKLDEHYRKFNLLQS